MIASLGRRLSAVSERWMPDPFVFALLLTLITFVLALLFGESVADDGMSAATAKLLAGWYGDFFGSAGLMKFALQMCIVLVTGHAIAMSVPARAAIDQVVKLAKTPQTAGAVVVLFASLASLVQWGLGAIAGAFLAREMGRAFARRGQAVHYPLLGAAGYAGFVVWHGGLSGSAPLKVAEPKHFLVEQIGVIPVSETLFSPLNFAATGAVIVVLCAIFFALMPSDESEMTPYQGALEDQIDEDDAVGDPRSGLVRALESSRLLGTVMGLSLLGVAGWWFAGKGAAGWNLDSINLVFLGVGLLLHGSPLSYVRAIAEGVRGAGGIILQFPFYFGILGLLKASGLIVQIAHFFVSISTETTFPIFTFLSAGIVNFFVPSGGGQWAVQGPVMMEALQTISVDPARVVMAVSYGDAWTNMLQPFWALPLLGIMGLRARDIIGYTAFVMLATAPVFIFMLAFV